MTETVHTFKSASLGNERSIWIRAPREPARPYGVAILLDGELYRDRVEAPAMIAELETKSGLANTLIVYVSMHSMEARWIECPCYPPFAEFINRELLPWLERLHPAIAASRERVLIGLSYTGLAAAFVALHAERPFSHIIAQSGSFWSQDCWLTEQYRLRATRLPTAFYLDVGTKETATHVRHKEDVLQVISQIAGVRKFRDVLGSQNYEVNYREFVGGHEFAAWKKTLPDALRWALPAASVH